MQKHAQARQKTLAINSISHIICNEVECAKQTRTKDEGSDLFFSSLFLESPQVKFKGRDLEIALQIKFSKTINVQNRRLSQFRLMVTQGHSQKKNVGY